MLPFRAHSRSLISSGECLAQRRVSDGPANAMQTHTDIENVITREQTPLEKLAVVEGPVTIYGGFATLENGELIDLAQIVHDHGNAISALRALTNTARTFRAVPKDEQEWTSIDDEALDAAFAILDKHDTKP
jgi:hypothetical protein